MMALSAMLNALLWIEGYLEPFNMSDINRQNLPDYQAASAIFRLYIL